ERRAEDFRGREFRPALELLLGIEADRDAARDPSAPAGTLRGRRPRDRLDAKLVDLLARRVALDAREAGVDHVMDAWNRERRFRDVGGEHDAPLRARLE